MLGSEYKHSIILRTASIQPMKHRFTLYLVDSSWVFYLPKMRLNQTYRTRHSKSLSFDFALSYFFLFIKFYVLALTKNLRKLCRSEEIKLISNNLISQY